MRTKKKDPLKEIGKGIQRLKYRLANAEREASGVDSDPDFPPVHASDLA